MRLPLFSASLLAAAVLAAGCRVPSPDATNNAPAQPVFSLSAIPGGEGSGESFEPATMTDPDKGAKRKIARTSISPASAERFHHLGAVLAKVPADDVMANREAWPNEEANEAARLREEHRNVEVWCWMLAAKREADNSFKLIVGSNAGTVSTSEGMAEFPATFMVARVSGLPDGGPHVRRLTEARQGFLGLLNGQELGGDMVRFDPPVRVFLEGSLLFNPERHPVANDWAPDDMKPTTAWEISPVARVVAK